MKIDNATSRFLSRSDLFKGLPEKYIHELDVVLQEKRVVEDESVFHEREMEGPLYLVRSGTVRIEMRSQDSEKPSMVQIVKEGEIFGEFSFVDHLGRSATARAMEDSHLYILSREIFEKYAEQRPRAAYRIAMNIAFILTTRFRKTNLQLAEELDEE
jgi:CRP-like cAMP-binding protein